MAEFRLLPSPPIDRCAGEAAPMVDVLFDQLEYLVSHARQGCLSGCPDCARLEQVKKLLLIPFDSPNMPQAPEPVAA